MYHASISLFIIRRKKWQKLEDQYIVFPASRKRLHKEMAPILVNHTQAARPFMMLLVLAALRPEHEGAKSLIEAKEDEFK
jgi:hypothetical protein